MARYNSQRDKISNYIKNNLIPNSISRELDYYKIVSIIASDLGVSESLVEEILKSFIRSGVLIEERTIKLSEAEVMRYQDQLNKEFKEAGLP